MTWEDCYRQYLLAQSTADCNLGRLSYTTVAASFATATLEDMQWLLSELADRHKKSFAAIVLGHADFVPEHLFDALVKAAVYEPDPSDNRFFIEPAIRATSLFRVYVALLTYLETGTNREKAGAINALYWVNIPLSGWAMTKQQRESYSEPSLQLREDLEEVRGRVRHRLLQEFVANDDVGVQRSIIGQLSLVSEDYPETLQDVIPKAIDIARNHADDYIRRRLENQLEELEFRHNSV